MRIFGLLTFVAVAVSTASGAGITIATPFSSSYAIVGDFFAGTDFSVPTSLGGITFLDNNTLLIGGNANTGGGAIYALPVTRGAGNQISGFGTATLYAMAPNIDGGLAFGPGGDLYFTGFPNDSLGEIKPGSTAPDLTIDLSTLSPSVASTVGTLGIVPTGIAGAGSFKIASYTDGLWYDATLTSNNDGTYGVSVGTPTANTSRGPEGIVWIAAGNPQFSADSALVSEYSAGTVSAYLVDADGTPVAASRQDFITGLTNTEGATIDPVTGDFLFSQFGDSSQIVVVGGFNSPTPEPGTMALLGIGIVAAGMAKRRARG